MIMFILYILCNGLLLYYYKDISVCILENRIKGYSPTEKQVMYFFFVLMSLLSLIPLCIFNWVRK